MKVLRLTLLLTACMISGHLWAQSAVPITVKELAPGFGIRPQFLDDTIHIARYIDSLDGTNNAKADTCVTINAKLMAMDNVMRYDYRQSNDTIWIDATHYIEDYTAYADKIKLLSQYLLNHAHDFIHQEHLLQDIQQQTAVNRCRDTVGRLHRSIVNACEGIGINDKARKKELKDIYYAYLSVYNRYDLSMKRNDSAYLASLREFSQFQQHLIDNLLSSNSLSAKINNFGNTLKVRCEKGHSEVLRSYQRVFHQPTPAIQFASIDGYYQYINDMEDILKTQNSYLTVVDLREKITANSKRINSLYSSKSHDMAATYQQVTTTVNMVPAFTTLADAKDFIASLQEFTQVQDCYLKDYNRLASIQEHGDSIVRHCGMKYSDVAKAYKRIASLNTIAPKYMTLDDAVRFGFEMERFEHLQRQFDSIVDLRREIDMYKDTIGKGWTSHLMVYNGCQSIRKQFVFTPTFIDAQGGREFIDQLIDCRNMEITCINAIELAAESSRLNSQIASKAQNYRNIRKAYSLLEKEYMTLKSINYISELALYIQQLEAYVSVQEAILDTFDEDPAQVDAKLKGLKDINLIETILGL